MNLWRISRDMNGIFDSYDSAVVAAETEDAARRTHPGDCLRWSDSLRGWGYGDNPVHPIHHDTGWVDDIALVNVELIGVAVEGIKAGVIVASYHSM